MVANWQSVIDAEALSRRFCFHEPNGNWPRPMVNVLEALQPKLALTWAILVFQESLSSRPNSGSESQQRRWLDELISLIEREDVADYCDKAAMEAWHNDPNMNRIERGIARLYWTLQNYLQTNTQDYYLQVSAAVAMLADNGECVENTDELTFERAVTLFRRLAEENRVTQ